MEIVNTIARQGSLKYSIEIYLSHCDTVLATTSK